MASEGVEVKLSVLPPGVFQEVALFVRGLCRQWVLSMVIFVTLGASIAGLLYLDYQHNREVARQLVAYRSCVNGLLSLHVDAKSLPKVGIHTHQFYELEDVQVMTAAVGACQGQLETLQQATPPEGWTRWRMREHLRQVVLAQGE